MLTTIGIAQHWQFLHAPLQKLVSYLDYYLGPPQQAQQYQYIQQHFHLGRMLAKVMAFLLLQHQQHWHPWQHQVHKEVAKALKMQCWHKLNRA